MKRTFIGLSLDRDTPRSVDLTVLSAGGVHSVTAVEGEATRQTQAIVTAAPGGDWLVEQGGIVRTVRMTVDRDAAWLSTVSGTDPGSATTRWRRREAVRARSSHREAQIRSPMTGRVVLVSVEVGQAVTKGQVLVVVEAMKMEHALKAPADGRVVKLLCQVDQQVDGGVELVELAEPEAPAVD